MLFFKKQARVGIDIGNYSIKVALLAPNRKQIIDLIEKEIMPDRKYLEDTVDDERIIKVCKEALGTYISSDSGYELEISSSVRGDGVICNYIEFPPLDKKKLELAIQSATIKYIPYLINEAIITYIPVPPLKHEGGENKAFFFTALNKSFIEKRNDLFEKNGVLLKESEAHIVPLIRGFTANQGKFPDEFIAVINAGSRFTTVLVLRDGFPYFARDFSIGGSDFTYSFQMASQCSWRDAKEYNFNYDFTLREHSIESILLKWLDQIKKSLGGFTRLDRKLNLTISRIFLTGGSGRLKNLDRRLADYLNIPVVIDYWNKLKPENRNKDSFPGTYNIALGLNL